MRKRYPRYFRPRFDAWRTCRKNSEEQTLELIDLLPPLEGDLPPACPRGFIYTSCNDPYLDLYGRDLIRSAQVKSPDQHFHLHLYDPTEASIRSLDKQVEQGKLTVTWDYHKQAKQPLALDGIFYFQNLRFIRMWQVLKASQSAMFLVDSDAVIRNDLSPAFDAQKDTDVSLYLRVKRRNPLRRLLASAVIINPTENGIRYARDCAAVFVPYLLNGATEPIDQMLLHLVWRWHSKNTAGFHYGELDKSYSDWTYEDESFVWHAKGPRKDSPIPLEKIFGESSPPAT